MYHQGINVPHLRFVGMHFVLFRSTR